MNNLQYAGRKTLAQKIWAARESYALMAPFFILFTIFTLIPIISSIYLSFTNFNMLETPRWIGLSNYVRLLLDDQVFLTVLKNTLIFAFITGPIGYVLSFMLAWLINDYRPGPRSVWTLIFYAPTLAGNVFYIWTIIFSGDYYGLMNGWLMSLGILQEPRDWIGDTKYVLNVVLVVQLWLSFGAGFLAFIAGFQSIDKSLYEAGVIDGIKNRWQELWYITLPSMAPQLLFGAVMQISASFGVTEVVKSVAGFPTRGYAADTIGTYINDFGIVRFEMGYACT
ncbi:MAG: sugar ABC transporter permease, partial [Spirochaetaceae bacterium]|nr:sugar ABC transporter permease [Spirochaetaceae bacterium]